MMGHVWIEHAAALVLRWCCPLALASAAVAVGWSAAADGARSTLVSDLCGYTATAMVVMLIAHFASLALPVRRRPPATVSVNPWV
jgi:hypothetical protein